MELVWFPWGINRAKHLDKNLVETLSRKLITLYQTTLAILKLSVNATNQTCDSAAGTTVLHVHTEDAMVPAKTHPKQ